MKARLSKNAGWRSLARHRKVCLMTVSVGLTVIGGEFETDGFLPSQWQRQQQVKAKFC